MLTLILALAAALAGDPPPAPAPSAAPAPKMQMEPYQFVILRRPDAPKDYPEAKLEEIQQAHIGHLRAMAEAGKLMVAGPLADQPDPKMRGFALYRVGSLEEARRLAEEDPAVKAGRLEVVVMTWYTQKGAMTFPAAEEMARTRK